MAASDNLSPRQFSKPEPNAGAVFTNTSNPRQRYAEVHEAFKGQGLENNPMAMVRHPLDHAGSSYSYNSAASMMKHYDDREKNSANQDLHYHTESIDEQHGYPLNKHGEWALDDGMHTTDDSIAEIHNGKKDCKGTSCQYYKMPHEDRQSFHNWAVEHS